MVDTVVLLLVLLLATVGRATLPFFHETDDIAQSVRLTGVQILLGWLLIIAIFGGYTRRHTGPGSQEVSRLLRACVATAAAVGIGCYLTQFELSRGFFVLLFALGTPSLILGRLLVRRFQARRFRQGRWQTRVLVAGTASSVDDVARVLERESGMGYRVVGALTPDVDLADDHGGLTHDGHRLLGRPDEAVTLAGDHGAHAVIFASGAFGRSVDYRRAAWDLADNGLEMIVLPALTDVAGDRIRVQPLAGLPFVFVDPPQQSAADRRFKRAFDVVGASVALVLASPVMAVAAWRIRRHDGGPALYCQSRVGLGGEIFTCLKFRTMVNGADELRDQLADHNQAAGVLFKMADDPRVTDPGRWLRRYSLDELPQLINVIRGEMSLVGPRPPLPEEVRGYPEDMLRRLRARPGLTGLWQVSGRSTLSWEDTVRLDLYYVDNWSMVQDALILLRTVRAVIGGRGAS